MEHPLAQFKYCPKCGSPRFEVHNGKSKHCAECGFTYYFNPSSATVALILNERDELLVCRRGKEPAKGTLDLPGGFVDYEETAEEAMRRELLEETGAQALTVEYLFSLPNLYVYSDLEIPTLDMFFRCTLPENAAVRPADDVAECRFIPFADVHPEAFGLRSIRRAVEHMKTLAGKD